MSAPIVTWFNDTNNAAVTNWSSGQVDAGATGPETTLLIWNNRGGATPLAHMQDCRLTTTDALTDELDLVRDRWVRCRVNSIAGDTFAQIGGAAGGKEIRGLGNSTGIIQGVANAGTLSDTANFASVTLRVDPPLHNVAAGQRNFRLRVSYFYV